MISSTQLLLFSLAAALVFTASAGCSRPQRSALGELVLALDGRRPFEPRLSGGIRWVQCKPATKSLDLFPELVCSRPPEPGTPDFNAIVAATARINRNAAEDPSAENLHARGFARAIWGEDLDKAIEDLDQALAQQPENGRILTDLSAIHLVKAQRDGTPHELMLALEKAELATRYVGHELPEAHFNRALALRRLSLRAESRAGWASFLQLNPDPEWAAEAHEQMRALSEPLDSELWLRYRPLLEAASIRGDQGAVVSIVDRFRQPARRHAEDHLLPAWVLARSEGRNQEAASSLRIAKAIGDALHRLSGDRFIRDVVSATTAALPDTDRLTSMLEGNSQLQSGLRYYISSEVAAAREQLQRSLDMLRKAGNPLHLRASYYLALCDYQAADEVHYRESLRRLQEIHSQASSSDYLSLASQALRITGLIYSILGRYSEAVDAYQSALVLSRRTLEIGELATIHTSLATNLRILGDELGAWNHLHRSLLAGARIQNTMRRYHSLEVAVESTLETAGPQIAVRFLSELVSVARETEDPATIAGALRQRGAVQHRLGSTELALQDVAEAREIVDEISDVAIRETALGDVLAVAGKIALESDPRGALDSLDAAVDIFQRTSYHAFLAPTLLARADAHLALGNDDQAERSLSAAIAELESQRESVAEQGRRISFFDRSRAVFDQMVLFQVERRQRADRAFGYTERGRARVLLDWIQTRSDRRSDMAEAKIAPSFPALDEVAASLGSGVALVSFWMLEDRLFTWVVSEGDSRLETLDLGAAELRRLAARFSGAVVNAAGAPPVTAAAGELFERLMRPLLAGLPQGGSLVVVPDGPLHDIPFAALWNVDGERFLVQDRTVIVAPSASMYLASSATAAPRGPGPALVVGDPTSDLSRAAIEARRVAALYPDAILLLGNEAVARRFLPGRYQMVHFAGHAVVNTEAPLYSYLQFAASGSDAATGRIYARELLERDLSATCLVVLSACRTARGRTSPTEGATSLAWAFLARGVPSVIASLWDVEDRATAELMVAFHRRLLAGDDAAAALRSAQLKLFASPDPTLGDPASWAGFQLIGGVSSKSPS